MHARNHSCTVYWYHTWNEKHVITCPNSPHTHTNVWIMKLGVELFYSHVFGLTAVRLAEPHTTPTLVRWFSSPTRNFAIIILMALRTIPWLLGLMSTQKTFREFLTPSCNIGNRQVGHFGSEGQIRWFYFCGQSLCSCTPTRTAQTGTVMTETHKSILTVMIWRGYYGYHRHKNIMRSTQTHMYTCTFAWPLMTLWYNKKVKRIIIPIIIPI